MPTPDELLASHSANLGMHVAHELALIALRSNLVPCDKQVVFGADYDPIVMRPIWCLRPTSYLRTVNAVIKYTSTQLLKHNTIWHSAGEPQLPGV